jgi:thiamine-phosphate pyrophosphorylase
MTDYSPFTLHASPFHQFGPLYTIIDTDVCRERGVDPLAHARACLRGGAKLLQVRQKSGSSAALLDLARAVVAAAREHGAAVVVNDRADLARLAGAAGVHVGQNDLAVDDVRRIVGPDAIVGISTHDEAQVDGAAAGTATYVAVGPIYGTGTKETGYGARGLGLVRYAAGRTKPVVAIGGITLERAPALAAAGAAALAVIGDLFATGDPEQRVRDYRRALER